MTVPNISVVLPVYNGEKYLGKAIESILGQTYADFEFIIINDGSKDTTPEIIQRYAEKDSRIVVIHQENAGLVATLNRGLSSAKAPFIARMDADDIALPDRFKDQIAYMQMHPEIAVLGTSIRFIDENDQPIHDSLYPSDSADVAAEMLRTNPVAHPTVMMRKSVIDAEGGYNRLFNYAEDYELWLRISEKYSIANLAGIYLLYRQHENKVSFLHSQDQTLRTFVAQLTSKARRAGNPDPLLSVDRITTDTLSLFGLTEKEKAEYIFRTFEYTLNAFIFNKEEEPVIDLLTLARNTARKGNVKTSLSNVLLKASLFYVINKRYGKSLLLILEAFWQSPATVFKTAFRLAKKILKRLIKTIG